ncbi:MAG TPA: twin-arginine translocase TatA/TatE family subunit [Bryobacteraceae bacterium]|nr:twin-arginine translocase TatA/TatE family subunit [Bryobacteraceae bacterium]
MGPIGIPEMMGIFMIALLLFGPKKLPELGKLLAKGLTEFRRAKNELKTTFETHLHELEKETRLETQSYTPPVSAEPPPSYPYIYDEYGHSDTGESAVSTEATASQPAAASPAPTPEPAASSPVAGTVPRSNGVASNGSFSAAPKEEHPV